MDPSASYILGEQRTETHTVSHNTDFPGRSSSPLEEAEAQEAANHCRHPKPSAQPLTWIPFCDVSTNRIREGRTHQAAWKQRAGQRGGEDLALLSLAPQRCAQPTHFPSSGGHGELYCGLPLTYSAYV